MNNEGNMDAESDKNGKWINPNLSLGFVFTFTPSGG
jgi:hypothetical protein